MDQFIKPKNLDYKNDSLYIDAVKLIGIKNPTVGGSYLKYGKNKACDMDLSENIGENSFSDYIKKIISNKKQFELLDAYFDEPHTQLLIIKDKLGYLDGNLKKFQKESIMEDVNKLPKDLKEPIENIIQEYTNSKSINDFIKLKLFIKTNLYPRWTMKDLKRGELTYHGQTFRISDYNFSVFYIEILLLNFRVSNYIIMKESPKDSEKLMIWDIDDIVYDNKLSYFKLLKKFMVLIKWLYFNKLIEDKQLYPLVIEIYNRIFNFVEELGNEYNSNCSIKNKIDLSKVKLIKYTNKLKKHSDKKYQKFIDYHKKTINKYKKIYIEKMDTINDKSKMEYQIITRNFIPYLAKYVRIY
jgi:hypothetical protein